MSEQESELARLMRHLERLIIEDYAQDPLEEVALREQSLMRGWRMRMTGSYRRGDRVVETVPVRPELLG